MDDTNRIIELNQTFYKKIQEEFSKSRQKPFKGWKGVGEYITENFNNPNILDLGCGNGRFIKFFKKTYPDFDLSYTGADSNDFFLKEAKKTYPKGIYIKTDIFRNLNTVKGRFDVILGFGITHHFPSIEFAKKWVNQVLALLNKDGVLILSFWIFESSPGKYIIGWGNKENTTRICRQFSEPEIESIFSKTVLIDKFREKASKKGNHNVYYILK